MIRIDLHRQLNATKHGGYRTEGTLDPNDCVEVQGDDAKMTSYEKSYAKDRKDSQISNSSKKTKGS